MICDKCDSLKKHLLECEVATVEHKVDCAMAQIWYQTVIDKGDLEGYKRTFNSEELLIVSATFKTIEKELKRLLKEK